MQQLSFFKHSARKEHGGALSVKKRRSRRPLATKAPLHISLRSQHAKGARSLLRHKGLIEEVLKKASHRFGVKIYRRAIVGNHVHLVIYSRNRVSLQNFFRVVAGHIAQGILKEHPLPSAGGAPRMAEAQPASALPLKPKQYCKKNQRRFWEMLIYSRILTWGKEFKTVCRYIVQNTLEALNIIAYTPRKKRVRKDTS